MLWGKIKEKIGEEGEGGGGFQVETVVLNRAVKEGLIKKAIMSKALNKGQIHVHLCQVSESQVEGQVQISDG